MAAAYSYSVTGSHLPGARAATGREPAVNAYEQLVAIRHQLELNGASEDSVDFVEKYIKRAESERDSNTSVAQVMMVRHLLRRPEAVDSDKIYNDLQELMSGFEARRLSEDEVRPAYEDNERHPRPRAITRPCAPRKKKRITLPWLKPGILRSASRLARTVSLPRGGRLSRSVHQGASLVRFPVPQGPCIWMLTGCCGPYP
jgi:hypothetical protein